MEWEYTRPQTTTFDRPKVRETVTTVNPPRTRSQTRATAAPAATKSAPLVPPIFTIPDPTMAAAAATASEGPSAYLSNLPMFGGKVGAEPRHKRGYKKAWWGYARHGGINTRKKATGTKTKIRYVYVTKSGGRRKCCSRGGYCSRRPGFHWVKAHNNRNGVHVKGHWARCPKLRC